MNREIYTVCVLLGLTFNQTLGMEIKTKSRPSIPQEWRTDKLEHPEVGKRINLRGEIFCYKANEQYVNNTLTIQAGVARIEEEINKILAQYVFSESEIKKTINELTIDDAKALREAIKEHPKVFEDQLRVEYEHKNKHYFCRTSLSLQELFENAIKPEELGPLLELEHVLKSDPNQMMGMTGSNLGNVVYAPSHMLGILYDSVSGRDKVLDIGGSRGIQAFPLLNLGAHVTVLDLSQDDIETLKNSTPLHMRERLETIIAKFPLDEKLGNDDLIDKFSIILMSHVAHYLTGDELREGIKKIKLWLKEQNGRFYFQALTPYARPYAWRMLIADERQKQGDEWPGSFSEEEKHDFVKQYPNKGVKLYGPRGSMPDYGHPIHPDIIKRELEAQGFEILYINYGNFNQNLIDKRYPVAYQDLEKYVKRYVFPISPEEVNRIKSQLGRLPDLLQMAENDANAYKYQHDNPESAYQSLQSMTTVHVIAKQRDIGE